MQDHEDLILLTEVAREAGEIAMRHFRKEPKIWDKGDNQGPVTEADLAINDMLEQRLRAARPDYGFMSEESADDAARLAARDVFILDPIDGTRSFIDGATAFSHSFGIARDGEVRAGVVFLPARDRLYAAVKGRGATMNDRPITANTQAHLPGAEVLATRPTFDRIHWPGPIPVVKRSHRPSLAYRFCLVAEGRYDAMITLRNAWEWDTAAGTLIAQEAGAVVTDAAGAPITFNATGRQHPGVIVAAPALHAELLALR